MRHYVFMKFEPGYFDTGVFEYIRLTFARLQSMLPEDILFCRVSRNCVEREQNMDLMIEMELRGPEALEIYLQHPLHKAIGERMNSHVVQIASFDCR